MVVHVDIIFKRMRNVWSKEAAAVLLISPYVNKLFSGLALGPSLRTLFAEAARSINMQKVNMLPLGK